MASFTRTILFLSLTSFLSCNSGPNVKPVSEASKIDTTAKSYDSILTEREAAAAKKKPNTLGHQVKTILFQRKTTDLKTYSDGVIPWASIGKPEKDFPTLIDRDIIVIDENKITIIIDYPLTHEYRFDMVSNNGFTRVQLLKEISKQYYNIYDEEEKSATIKTVPPKDRTTTYNRNQTNGKYGIWGHDISDMDLEEISVFKTPDGQLVLSLNVAS